jgi:hypothetical protein
MKVVLRPEKDDYNSIVKSVLIYGAEVWSLYENDRRRINATEMDALRRYARILTLRLPNLFLNFSTSCM